MTLDDNKALVGRLFDEVWNAGKLDSLAQIIDVDGLSYIGDNGADLLEGHQSIGFTGLSREIQITRSAFANLKLTVQRVVAEDDIVVVAFDATGTNDGVVILEGGRTLPAIGQSFRATAAAFHLIQNGKIHGLRICWSPQSLISQVMLRLIGVSSF